MGRKEKDLKGKPEKRPLKLADIDALRLAFHWGFEFDKELSINGGGFDAIITNPPWEIFKPNGKEFFEEHSDFVTKKSMTIHEFEKEQASLLRDDDIRAAWHKYLNQFAYQSAYFRLAPDYKNQISVVNGKKAGTDINLYKLFAERCFNLLRPGGECGIVIPSGIYTAILARSNCGRYCSTCRRISRATLQSKIGGRSLREFTGVSNLLSSLSRRARQRRVSRRRSCGTT